jgi:arylsulfatase A-like enzyme
MKAFVLALSAVVVAACGDAEPARRPNVILISLDTLRADHMGLYGYERDTTPYLDRMADESLVFERAFAPAAWTLISHMTMLTGLYSNQHGVVAGDRALARDTPLLAQRLVDQGYQTLALYYEGWISARHGFGRGFDVFRPHETVLEAGVHLDEELARLDPERPFFLFVHLFDIHCGPLATEPGPLYHAPPPYDTLFLPDAAARIPPLPEKRLWKTQGLLDEQAVEGLVALYDGGIRYVDDQLAEWIEGWKASGLLDETLLIVTADHGEALLQRETIRDHGGGYQEGLRVPLILRDPRGWRAGERELGTAHLADIAPTVLDFVGDRRAALLPGQSLLDVIPGDRLVYSSNPKNYEVLVRWPDKWVRLPRNGRYLRIDLDQDPEEVHPMPLEVSEFDRLRALFHEQGGSGANWSTAIEADALDTEALQDLSDMGYGGGE